MNNYDIKNHEKLNVVVPLGEGHIDQFIALVPFLIQNLNPKKIIVIANQRLKDLVTSSQEIEFIDEDLLIKGMNIEAIENIMKKLVNDSSRSGWYFQQFLKMGFSYSSKDLYYVIWDADTIPLNPICFYHSITGKPYFTMKNEHHLPYFETIAKLFDGEVCKKTNQSFIAEEMIVNKEIMLEIISRINEKRELVGDNFFEKILHSIDKNNLIKAGFSEFETYGNYVMCMHPDLYEKRELRSMREGGFYFQCIPEVQTLRWIAKSYDTITFENHIMGRPVPEYLKKLIKYRVISFGYVRRLYRFSNLLKKWFCHG